MFIYLVECSLPAHVITYFQYKWISANTSVICYLTFKDKPSTMKEALTIDDLSPWKKVSLLRKTHLDTYKIKLSMEESSTKEKAHA